MKQFLKDNWFKIGILILLTISVFSYFSSKAQPNTRYELKSCLENIGYTIDSPGYKANQENCFRLYPQ